MKTSLPVLAVLCGLWSVGDPARAQDWSITTLPQACWTGVACSADGTRLVALGSATGIWVSTNRGATWTPTDTSETAWSGIASSADGTKLAAVSQSTSMGAIYISTNSGNTWHLTSAPTDDYRGIVSSPDGTKLAAVSREWGAWGVYTSTNSGASWNRTTAVPMIGFFQSVALSADGTKLAAAGGVLSPNPGVTGGGEIEYSTDSGVTWHLSDAPQTWEWSAIACSSNGNFMVAAAYGDTNNNPGPVYISTNSGVNWMPSTAPHLAYGAVACSADGSKITVACLNTDQTISPNAVYSSTNSGATWTQDQTLMDAGSIVYSADGTKRVATTAGGALVFNYVAVSPPLAANVAPQLGITVTGNKVVISWPASAAGYALETTTNLSVGKWGGISDGIFTVGANCVFTNSTSGRTAFFRLKQ
jgi:hypothetical protein